MENQVLKKEGSLQQVVLILLAIVATVFLLMLGWYQLRQPDPYARGVLTITGTPGQGRAIFEMNCAGCHGFKADGRVGPSLRSVSSRKSKVGIIHQVTSGQTPPMPQFQPSSQEMADLLSYLETL